MRREDWPERLNDVLARYRGQAFVWGCFDCVTFCADVVLAMTGEDPAALVRGEYEGEFGAIKTVRRYGADLAELWERKLGAPIPVKLAQRGDVVMRIENSGICVGEAAAFMGLDGLTFVPVEKCDWAFRVS